MKSNSLAACRTLMPKTLTTPLLYLILATSPSQAGTLWFDGGTTNIAIVGDGASAGAGGSWNTTVVNWDPGTGLAHASWNNTTNGGDTAVFGELGNVTATVAVGAVSAGNLTFTNSSSAATSSRWNFTGGSITLGTVNSSATIDASGTLSTGSTGFFLNGTVLAGSVPGGLTLVGAANNYATLYNTVSPGRVNLLVLKSANTFTGPVFIKNAIELQVASVLGPAANNITLQNGTLLMYGALTIPNNVRVTGTANAVNCDNGNAAVFSGAITTDTASDVLWSVAAPSRTLTYSGDLSGFTGTFMVKSTTGSTVIDSASAFGGTFQVDGGTLQIGNNDTMGSLGGNNIVNNGTINYNRTDNQTYAIALSGTGGLTVSSGALTLSGANTYAGPTTVTAGILKLAGGSLGDTAISTESGATFAIQPGSATAIQAGTTGEGTAGATLNLNGTLDMSDGAVSTFNLQQQAGFVGTALTAGDGAAIKLNLGNVGADLLAVTRDALVNGAVNVTLDTTGATSLTAGHYNLVTAASGLAGGVWQFAGGVTGTNVMVGGVPFKLTLTTSDTAVGVTVENRYTVAYDGNGHTGGAVPVDASSPYDSGSTVPVLSPGTLTRTGYSFSGWNTQAGGGGTNLSPAGSFPITANTTLYARWTLASSTITANATLPGTLSSTYGTASATRTVAVSGSGLTGNITATAPGGLEVSSNGSTYGSTATFTRTGTSVSGTLSVRIRNNASVTGSPYDNLAVTLTSPGASTLNVATTSGGNTVTAKALVIASATAAHKLYDGTNAATVNGVLMSSEAFGTGTAADGKPYTGDALTVSCAGSTFASPDPANGISVTAGTFTLGGASAGNYSLTQPALSLKANILTTAVWTQPADGSWVDVANWLSGLPATGADLTADFTTLALANDILVTLDAPRTIGNLSFDDKSSIKHSWTLETGSDGPLTLALAGGSPVITNKVPTTIAVALAGNQGLTKTGSGVLTLSGTNTYTGDTWVDAGTLKAGSSTTVFGDNSLVMLADAADVVLDLDSLSIAIGSLAGGGTNGGKVTLGEGTLTTGANNGSTNFDGIIEGTGGLVKTGIGIQALLGVNTYTGATTVNGGGLILVGANATSAVIVGANRFSLNGANALVSGTPITATTGFVILGDNQTTGANVTFNGASRGTLVLGGESNWTGSLTVNASSTNGLNVIPGANATLSGNIVNDGAGVGLVVRNDSGTFTSYGANTPPPGTLTISGIISGAGAFQTGVSQTASNTTLTAVNTYTGNTLIQNAGSQLVIAGAGSLGAGSYAGNITFATSGATFRYNSTADQTLSGIISGAGGRVTKESTGTLLLTGANTYTGATTVNGGILSLANPYLADASTITIASGATLDLTHSETDTIDKLFINGVQQAAGIYKSSAGIGEGTVLASLTGTGKLQVTTGPVSSTFASWMSGNDFSAFPGADLTANGDADHDGISNLVEHVLGTAPNAATTGLTQVGTTASSLTFKHRLNTALAADVSYSYQWSSDLGEWKASGASNSGGTTVTISAGAAAAGEVTVTTTISAGPATKLFVRLVANKTP